MGENRQFLVGVLRATLSAAPHVDPAVDGRAALLVEEVPRGRIIAPYRPVDRGLDRLQALISSPEAAIRMQRDGVRSATMTTYVAG